MEKTRLFGKFLFRFDFSLMNPIVVNFRNITALRPHLLKSGGLLLNFETIILFLFS